MKSLIAALILIVPSLSWGAFDVRDALCTSSVIGAVSVSTTTPTLLSVGSSNLAGRTRFEMSDVDWNYYVAVGTSSAVTTSTGFIVTASSGATTAKIVWPVGSNVTLYGIGEPNAVRSTVNVRIFECAQ